MKKEPNNHEIKFRSLYYGQKVFVPDEESAIHTPIRKMFSFLFLKDGHLLLRSVSQLTHEEKIILISLSGDYFTKREVEYGVDYFNFTIDINNSVIIETNLGGVKTWSDINNKGIDYLRSISILLPFNFIDDNGKPVTMSEQDIINENWAKIKGV